MKYQYLNYLTDYYYFYLGKICNSPVMKSDIIQFTGNMEYKFVRAKLYMEQIKNEKTQAEKTISTSTHVTGVEQGFSYSKELGLEAGVGAEYGGVSASIKATVQTTFSSNLNISHEASNTFGEEISTSSTYENLMVNQYSESHEYLLNLTEENGFKLNHHYRLAFYRDLDVYAIVMKDLNDNSYSYEYQTFITNSTDTRMVLEESKDGKFNNQDETSLDFDLEKAIKSINEINKTTVTVNSPIELGTKNMPFIIDNEEEFKKILETKKTGKYYKLSSNIEILDLSKYEFPEILDCHIDFNNAILKKLNISLPEGASGKYGLFKNITENGGIYNAIFENNTISGNNFNDVYVGIVCGENAGIIEGCKFRNNKISHDSNSKLSDTSCYAGMVCGKNTGTISSINLEYANNIFVDSDTQEDGCTDASYTTIAVVGGVCGINQGTVKDCTNNATSSNPSSLYARSCHHNYDWSNTFFVACGSIIGHNKGNVSNLNTGSFVSMTSFRRQYSAKVFIIVSWSYDDYKENIGGTIGA